MMMHSGHGNRCGVECQVAPQQRIGGQENRNTVLRFNFGCAPRIRLKGGNKLYACARLFQFAVDAKMVAPEGSAACHGNAQIELAADATLPCLPRP